MTTRLLGPILVLLLAGSALGAVCGNGVIEAGEECDDGNVVSGDGCSALCVFEGCPLTGTWRSTFPFDVTWTFVEAADGTLSGVMYATNTPVLNTPLTGSRTGKSVSVERASQLFTGTMTDCDAIPLAMGSLEFDLTRARSTYCGDGITQPPDESCDDGDFINGDECNVNCIASFCGDGIVEGPEQCDDGNLTNGDGCSTECQVNVCGNATIESGEQCDDGNTINGDGCSARCQSNVCGNGVVENGEECDDGNAVSGDGCSALCAFEGCPLTGTWRSTFPFEFTWTFVEAADGTLSGVRYASGSPTNAFPVTGSRTGKSVSIDQILTGTMVDCDTLPVTLLDQGFVLIRTRSTYCGDGTTQPPDESCDDGNLLNGDDCTVACALAICGNGIVEGSEQCDDGNPTNGDGCSTECQVNVCGNGTIESGEQCDDGNTISGDGCSARCQSNVCGNGVIEDGEECDDGNAVSGDGCSALCAFEGCPLTGTWRSISTWDQTWTFVEAADGTISGLTYFTGAPASTFPVTGSRTGRSVSISLGGAFLLTGTMDTCDAFPLAMSPLDFHLARTRSTYCGDGVQQAAVEVCDDGNFDNGDGCTVACSAPSGCGNGLLESGEECDDANGSNDDACAVGCALNVCGDGFVKVGTEACDDGNTTSGDGCAADCLTLEEESASGAVGGSALTVTTDTEADGATPSDPVETTLSAPPGTLSGTLAITEQTAPPIAPAGFVFMGTSVHVTATDIVPAPTATTPLSLGFQIDASVVASGQSENTIEIRKDGDAVSACVGSVGEASPDPCVATRERLPDGDIAIGILTTTLSDWDFSGSVCGAGPLLGCQPALSKGAKLKIKAGSNRDVVGWTWKSSAETPLSIFGDPRSTNDYTLCVYDSTGPRMQFTAPAGSTCKDGKSCWALGSKGFKYADRSSAHDGISHLVLKPGNAGRAKLGMVAKGQLDLAALPLTLPVSVQLRAKDGACFQAAFGAAKRNDAYRFQATND